MDDKKLLWGGTLAADVLNEEINEAWDCDDVYWSLLFTGKAAVEEQLRWVVVDGTMANDSMHT
ncbi:hypothetical protein HDV62DRAFT_358580 [Trichoderma sp. SZMC 28011]